MLKQTCLHLAIFTTFFTLCQPANARNLVSSPIYFRSNSFPLPQTSGYFEFDTSNSWLSYGSRAFELTSLNFQSPLGTNYSLNDIIDEYFYDEQIPAYIPSTQDFVFLNFNYIDPENGNFELELVGSSGFWLQKPGGIIFSEGILLQDNEYGESSIISDFELVNDTGIYSLVVVPEPLTLLGVGTALSFGAAFKRKIAKKKQNF